MSNETSAREPKRQKNRRRSKFARKDLQLKIIFGTLFVALIVLVINFHLPIMGMSIMRATSSIWLDTHYNLMINMLVTSFTASLLLAVPLAIWMGTVFSFQFCGPIYNIKKFFVELSSGRWDRVCTLRKGDDLQDVKEVINQYLSLACGRIQRQHEVLEEVRGFLETCNRSEEIDSLLALIAVEDTEYAHRLGTPRDDHEETTTAASCESGATGDSDDMESSTGEATVATTSRGR